MNSPTPRRKAQWKPLRLALRLVGSSLRITVNAVDPGASDTGWITEQAASREVTVGVAKFNQPDDAARAIVFLARAFPLNRSRSTAQRSPSS